MTATTLDSPSGGIEIAVHTRVDIHRWLVGAATLSFDATPGSPWLLVPPHVRRAFDALTARGTALAGTAFGAPLLGVKCGCNEAFIVTLDDPAPDAFDPEDRVAVIQAVSSRTEAVRHGRCVERALLRPVVRGETLGRWLCGAARDHGVRQGRHGSTRRAMGPRREWIIWTHDDPALESPGPLAELPTHAARWFGHWRHRLAARSDTRGHLPWWALFRTGGACPTHPRVVWADVGRAPRAACLPSGDTTVPLNSCYVARAPDLIDAQALTALLNSAVAAAWLNILAEPARGGYRRYLAWTVGLLPLPSHWERAREILAPLTVDATRGAAPSEARLTEVVAVAYGLDLDALQPLLAWSGV